MPSNESTEQPPAANGDDYEEEKTLVPSEVELGSTIIRSKFLSIRDRLWAEGRLSATAAGELGHAIEDTSLGIGIRVPKDLLDVKLVRIQDMGDLSWLNNLSSVVLALFACFLGALISSVASSVRSDVIYLLITFCVILAGITTFVMLRRDKLIKAINSEDNFVSVVRDNISISTKA